MIRRQLVPVVLLVLMAAACAEKGPPPKKDELAAALKDPKVVILDVRTASEYSKGHVPGAVHLHVDEIANAPEKLKDKSAPIVVHCAAGVRSARAKKALTEQGYTNIIDAQTPETVAKAMGVELEK